MSGIRRREFVILLVGGAAAAWPLAARAQQPATPVVGFLRSSKAAGSEHIVAGLRRGLHETGYVDGQNVAIEYRWGDDHLERLPGLAADLVSRRVSVIVGSSSTAAVAAKAATPTIPIVFVMAVDPVKSGLVASLNRPGGNATGITYLTSALGGKRLDFLLQLVPAARSVAVLVHPDDASSGPLLNDLRTAAAALGLRLIVLAVRSGREFEGAFADLARQGASALIAGATPLFTSHTAEIAALAARRRLPAIYTNADYVRAGGLMAWGVSLTDQYRLGGTYVGKILKGAKPADLPVLQPTKYEFTINLKAAAALGLTVPDKLLALADEVIE